MTDESIDTSIDVNELGRILSTRPPLNIERTETNVPQEIPSQNLFGTLFRRDTTPGAYLNATNQGSFEFGKTPILSFLQYVPQRHMSHWDAYALVTNEREAQEVMRAVDQEIIDNQTIAQNPWKSFFYSFGAQALDPVNWMPGTVIFNNYKNLSKAAKAAIEAGSAGLASTAIQEALIQTKQLTRSADESVFNTLAAGTLSAVLGGGVTFAAPKLETLSFKAKEKARQGILDVYTETTNKLSENGMLGANDIANMPEAVQKGMVTSLMNRMFKSEFDTAKKSAAELYEHGYTLTKNEAGIANVNAETNIKLDLAKASKTFIDYQDIFFNQAGVERGFLAARKANRAASLDPSGRILNFETFDSEVSKTIFSGQPHSNRYVNQAAELLNKNIFEPYREAAISLGLLPPEVSVKNAANYFSVYWNTQKIKENQVGFEAMSRDWFIKVNDTVKEVRSSKDFKNLELEIKKTKEELKRAKQEGKKDKVKSLKETLKNQQESLNKTARTMLSSKLSADEIEGMFHTTGTKKGQLRKPKSQQVLDAEVRQTTDRILGRDNSRLKDPVLSQLDGKPHPLKDRTYLIPQRIAFDWQVQSASEVARMYTHAMSPVIRMSEMAKQNGFDSIKGWYDGRIAQLKAELDTKLANASGKEAATLNKNFQTQKQNIRNSFELLLGIYGDGPNIHDNSAAKYYKFFLNWNYIRLLGFMTLSAIPDIGLHVFTHGPFATIYHGLRPVLKDMFGVMKNMSKDDLQAMGYALNTSMGTRLKSLAGHEGLSTQPTFFAKAMDSMVQSYGNVTLMNQWNDLQQVIAGTMSINRSLKAIEAGVNGRLSKAEATRLAKLGISENEFKHIHDMWREAGGIDEGTYFANWTKWDANTKERANALQAFQRSVAREIDSIVIVPGLGDKPLFAQENLGKLLFQFKSFAFAATNKIFFSGMQRTHDINMYQGMVTMLALGALSYVTTQVLRGNDNIDLSFKTLAKEAIDRSGLIGIGAEVYNLAEKAGLGFGENVSRYQSRGLWGALLGPTTGAVEDILTVVNRMRKADSQNPLTTKDLEKIFRLFPYQNLFYTYALSRKLMNEQGGKLGFEPSAEQKFKDIFKRD